MTIYDFDRVMRHQKIILELATQQQIEPERQRTIHSKPTRRKQTLVDRPSTQQTRIHPSRRRQRRLRRDRWHKLVILIPTVVLSLLLSRWLLSLQTQFSQASTFRSQPAPILVSPVDALSHAIINQESTHNHQSLNPHSQALGLAQIMPANIGAWSKEALGHSISVDEFLSNPTVQKQIIHYKLEQYWHDALVTSQGDEEIAVLRVASHWYSGSPDLYKSKAVQWYRGTDGKLHRYPSVAKYSNSILQKYKQNVGEVGENSKSKIQDSKFKS
ncbi:transglycosylase SLT domain-containing protein [Chroococcidiopsis sp. CCALA 051]|uniref:transglycosylase SLT domain-containing protein n=1 Tax=Chroococcidiopsis sp. CCALA 051 TaxID=869949 RepID=UPI0011B2837D|nr:transglycosylase SLT domain-containing protein [Chroococcidiopsis sp. CCALA 051]